MSRYDVCYKHRFEAPFATFFHSVKNVDSEFQACKKIGLTLKSLGFSSGGLIIIVWGMPKLVTMGT